MTIGIGGFLAGIASLPMYDFAELRVHTDLLWTAIAAKMRSAGVDDVPDDLTRPEGVLVDHWRRTELLFSQTCGYPLVRDLPNAQVLGSFSVSCGTERPGFYRSVLVARSNDPPPGKLLRIACEMRMCDFGSCC